jgi:hypothetical protein
MKRLASRRKFKVTPKKKCPPAASAGPLSTATAPRLVIPREANITIVGTATKRFGLSAKVIVLGGKLYDMTTGKPYVSNMKDGTVVNIVVHEKFAEILEKLNFKDEEQQIEFTVPAKA